MRQCEVDIFHLMISRDGGRDVRIMFRSEHKPDVG